VGGVSDRDPTPLRSPAVGGDLVSWAETQSRALLSDLGNRWLHVQGVTAKAVPLPPLVLSWLADFPL